MSLPRLVRTICYLKPEQVFNRLRFKLSRPKLDILLTASPVKATSITARSPVEKTPSMIAPDLFYFLGEEGRVADEISWNDPHRAKLWLYNLHYFDDLVAEGASDRTQWHQDLLRRWVVENPPTHGNGWEPYPISLRACNWIKYSLLSGSLPLECETSLFLQVRWLEKRLEWHLLGNHLFANAKALVFAGLYFEGDEANGWLERGLSIIAKELPEQVLPDGGNFELSPMYHAIFLEDVLDLINIAECYPGQVPQYQVDEWRETAVRMLGWLATMLHPDGDISLFNDAAIGTGPDYAALCAYAQRLGLQPSPTPKLPLVHLPDSGYVRLDSGGAVGLLDVARVGPDYIPGHAHADTLSFELSIAGQRVIVNGGTSRYGDGPERHRERSTAWHSTVELAGENSSEVWGGFRVGRRAYPINLRVSDLPDSLPESLPRTLIVSCSHNGYRYLPGEPVHNRHWQLEGSSLTIIDDVSVASVPAVARFILHPDVMIRSDDGGGWLLALPDGSTVLVRCYAGEASITDAWYAPRFGERVPTKALLVRLMGGTAKAKLQWK